METLSTDFLLNAIHSEIIARDAYRGLSGKIEAEDGKKVMAAMAEEEEGHRIVLASRYRAITGEDYQYDPDLEAGPDFSFIEKSTFAYTQALEALKLALGAEMDAIRYYSGELRNARDPEDKKMLKSLVQFEKKHRSLLAREIKRMERHNHWNLSQS